MATVDPPPRKQNLKQAGVIAAAAALVALAGCSWKQSATGGPVVRLSSSTAGQAGRSSRASAPGTPGSIFTNSIGAEMIPIPPGEFMIGSTPEERARARSMGATESQVGNEGERPRRSHIRNGFWIGRTEVTAGQWQQFVDDTRYQSDAVRGFAFLDSYPERQPEDHPVAWVTWSDAVAFCEWLTRKERQTNRLPERCIYRLPSEAEWEYACRAGRRAGMFWWGDSPKDGHGRLNWRGNGGVAQSASPVDACGARGRNGFGLADTLGNVRELCLDAWDAAGANEEFCADYTRSKSRVLKGGSFKSPAFDARCARRWPSLYSYGGSDIGFRVCCGINLSNETARVLSNLMTPNAKPSSPAAASPKKSP